MSLEGELLDFAKAVSVHFEGTDAPLGRRARELVAKGEKRHPEDYSNICATCLRKFIGYGSECPGCAGSE